MVDQTPPEGENAEFQDDFNVVSESLLRRMGIYDKDMTFEIITDSLSDYDLCELAHSGSVEFGSLDLTYDASDDDMGIGIFVVKNYFQFLDINLDENGRYPHNPLSMNKDGPIDPNVIKSCYVTAYENLVRRKSSPKLSQREKEALVKEKPMYDSFIKEGVRPNSKENIAGMLKPVYEDMLKKYPDRYTKSS